MSDYVQALPGPDGMQIHIHNHPQAVGGVRRWFGRTFFWLSILLNLFLLAAVSSYYSPLGVMEQYKDGDMSAPDKIALIPVVGLITAESVQAPKKELRRAAEDPAVKAVVLSVDSPGGTISGSDELYHAVERFREQTGGRKPIVTAMRGMATSGAYYIAAPTDAIVAERSCITGSIGVIVSLFEGSKLLEQIGVKSEVVKSGSMKDSGSMFRPMTEEERKEWQKLVNGMYEQFLGVVLKHRNEKVGEKKLRELADGRVFLAEEALTHKLIDAIGYQDDAIAEAKKLAQLPEKVRIVTYARPLDWQSMLLGGSTPSRPAGAERLLDAATPRLMFLPGNMPTFAR
jgi:protease-4